MVRTRKAIYVGNQEIQRRYIGNKLIFTLERNLIQNSNFSTGTTDGWGKESGLSAMRIVNDVYRSGGYSLLLQGGSAGARNYSNYIKAKEGEIFSLLYYAYITGYDINRSNYIEIVFLDSEQEIITEHKKRISELGNAPLNEWHQLKLENIKAPKNTHYVSVHLRWWEVSEDIYIDEIILVRDKSVTDWTPAPEDIT